MPGPHANRESGKAGPELRAQVSAEELGLDPVLKRKRLKEFKPEMDYIYFPEEQSRQLRAEWTRM